MNASGWRSGDNDHDYFLSHSRSPHWVTHSSVQQAPWSSLLDRFQPGMKTGDTKMIAFNYIPFVNVQSLTVKRKGKVIKRETQAAIAAAYAERRAQKNAAKRARKALRNA